MNPPNKHIQTVNNPLMRCVSTFVGSRTSAADLGLKAAHKRYNKSEKGKARYRRYESKHRGHWEAKNAVNHAIRAGKLSRPDSFQCRCCPEQAEQYHHYLGYEPECWLFVLPLCRKCHRKIHNPMPLGGLLLIGENDASNKM